MTISYEFEYMDESYFCEKSLLIDLIINGKCKRLCSSLCPLYTYTKCKRMVPTISREEIISAAKARFISKFGEEPLFDILL